METLNLNNRTSVLHANQQRTQNDILNRWFTKQADQFEATRFGMMAIYITIQSCLGGIAAMFILQNKADVLWLAAVTALTMAGNAVLIAQGKAKLCLALFYLNVVVSGVLIFVNIA